MIALLIFSALAAPSSSPQEYLVKLDPSANPATVLETRFRRVEPVVPGWFKVTVSKRERRALQSLSEAEGVAILQPNYPLHVQGSERIDDPLRRAMLDRLLAKSGSQPRHPDNPPLPDASSEPAALTKAGRQLIALLDTGVDYALEVLRPRLWSNPAEIPGNGIDDDGNGRIDDVMGWDFVSDDNQPYDLAFDGLERLRGDNPGYGTRRALDMKDDAPDARFMIVRFLSERAAGTTDQAMRAIHYAVDNGARLLSMTWDLVAPENKALHDSRLYAEARGALFTASIRPENSDQRQGAAVP